MKIAIWGSYNHGNFGDDLMAIIISQFLKRIGAIPVVYRLDKRIAYSFGIETTDSIEELIRGAKFCIIGGGGMLVSASVLKLLLTKVSRDFEKDFKELYIYTNKYNCTVYPISIGGDGKGLHSFIPYWRRKFFSSRICSEGTVRLSSDLEIMKKYGIKAEYYPDILLGISKEWPSTVKEQKTNKYNIGINLSKRTSVSLVPKILKVAEKRQDIILHFIRSHLPNYSHSYEILLRTNLSNVKYHIYNDPKETVEFLSSLDLLISSKLHLGVTALSYYVPFISFAGKGKTRTFLKESGLDYAIWKESSDSLVTFIESFTEKKKRDLQAKTTIIKALSDSSVNHFKKLQQLVTLHSK